MKKRYITLIAVLITSGSPMAWAKTFDPVAFAHVTFNDDTNSELAIAKANYMKIKNLINRKKKADEIYGQIIAKTILKTMSIDSAPQETLLNLLQAKLLKDFQLPQITINQSSPEALNAQELMGNAFEKYTSVPGGYLAGSVEAANLIRAAGINPSAQALRIDALISYLKTFFTIRQTINAMFNTKSLEDATNDILTQQLKNKNPIESRMIINLLIDKLIEKTGAKLSQATARNEGRATTEEVITWFKNAKASTMDAMSTVIQKILKDNYPAEKLFLILTTVRNLLIFAVTPAPLPQAQAWQPPAPSCPWYNLSCSIPWNTVGDGLKYAFSDEVWKDKVGGGLKVAFVDNVYEKGLKKLGDLINDNVIQPARDLAHTIRDALRTVADILSGTPAKITDGAIDIIGSKEKKTLSANLNDGAKKIDDQIKVIRGTIGMIEKQKADLIKQNLSSKKIQKLTELNKILVGDGTTPGAFDEVIAALNELVSPDCTTGALCDIKKAFEKSSVQALIGQKDIKENIERVDKKINRPTLLEDGVVEPLPTRLRNMAKLLDI